MQTIFLVLLIVPIIEIYLLIEIGGLIGFFPTLFLIIFTAVLGTWLLRQQGFATWQRFQEALAKGEVPTYEMIEGPILLIGGVLLIAPGFFTDMLGFACLIPQLRRTIAQYVIEHYMVQMQDGSPFTQPTKDRDAIEGEYRKED
jgi:UPF0716 protein FxsA